MGAKAIFSIVYQRKLFSIPRNVSALWNCQFTPQHKIFSRWGHQTETFSALLALCEGNSPITGEFPLQRPVTRSLEIRWFGTPSRSLWRHCNAHSWSAPGYANTQKLIEHILHRLSLTKKVIFRFSSGSVKNSVWFNRFYLIAVNGIRLCCWYNYLNKTMHGAVLMFAIGLMMLCKKLLKHLFNDMKRIFMLFSVFLSTENATNKTLASNFDRGIMVRRIFARYFSPMS